MTNIDNLPKCSKCGKWHPYPDSICGVGRVENHHLGFRYVGFDTFDSKTSTFALIVVALSDAQDFQSRNPTATITRAYQNAADHGSWAKPFYKSAYGPKIISSIGVGPDGYTKIWRGPVPNTQQEEYSAQLRAQGFKHGQ